MLAFSKLQTIAPQDALLSAELDIALASLFDVPAAPRPLRVFGVGASHAFDMEIGPYRIPERSKGAGSPIPWATSAARIVFSSGSC